MSYAVHHADVITYLRGRRWLVQNGYLPRYHAVLCDPPYGLAFMGKEWDTLGAHEFQAWVTEWAGLLIDYVYPGGVLMAFGGTRTYHRLAAGLEDAGWIVSDTIAWVTGQGFPKSHNLEKATGDPKWRGFGSAMKPAFEPCVICRAPRGNRTYAAMAREFGTGAINVDGGRIAAQGRPLIGKLGNLPSNGVYGEGLNGSKHLGTTDTGRWPSNFALVCACEGDEHADDCPVSVLGRQSGVATSKAADRDKGIDGPTFKNVNGAEHGIRGHDDAGTSARFFYQAKAAAWEREAGLTGFARRVVSTSRPNSPDATSKFPDHDNRSRVNVHPTVKPIRMASYLATLLLPPPLDEPRRLLVPFAGSGSEMIGARLAGWDVVTGIEREAEYVALARARVGWWERFSTYDEARAAWVKEGKKVKGHATPTFSSKNPILRCPEHGGSIPSGGTRYTCGCLKVYPGKSAPVVAEDKPAQIALFPNTEEAV